MMEASAMISYSGFRFLCIVSLMLLSGCMAAALVPTALHVGHAVSGSRDNVIQVTIDEKTFTPEVRSAFTTAKTMVVVAGDRASVKAADLFESRGGYQVTVDRTTAKVGEMTGSERREALRKICATARPDLALLGRTTKTETGNMWAGALTGRAKIKNEWTMEMLSCKTGTQRAFGGLFEIDIGLYNQKAESEYEELIGAEIGGKILDALGSARSSQSATQQPVPVPSASPVQLVPAPVVAPVAPEGKSGPMTVIDAQKRLSALGYSVGAPDGVLGRRTVEAIRKFQSDNRLQATGRIDMDTSAKLEVLSK